jgi:hypothetical protein
MPVKGFAAPGPFLLPPAGAGGRAVRAGVDAGAATAGW